MTTHSPVIVEDDAGERQLWPQEAEGIMGLHRDYTRRSGAGQHAIVPDIERLARLGDGIDTRQFRTLIDRLKPKRGSGKEHTDTPIGPLRDTVHDHVKPHTGWNVRWQSA